MFSTEIQPHTKPCAASEHFEREGGCAYSIELSNLLDRNTLEHMTDANTSEGDQSLDELMLAAYDSICEPLAATPANEHGRMASEPTTTGPRTQPTPPLLCGACAQTSLPTDHHVYATICITIQ